jgi:hypothetical protein
MSEDKKYPLRKNTEESIPQSFGSAVTNILSKGQVYEVTGAWAKRRGQLGLSTGARDVVAITQIQKLSGAASAQELSVNRKKRLFADLIQVERVWAVFSEICSELGNKGFDMKDTVASLRSMRTLTSLYEDYINRNVCATEETASYIKNELRSLEDKTIVEIQNKSGDEYASKWSAKLAEAWTME